MINSDNGNYLPGVEVLAVAFQVVILVLVEQTAHRLIVPVHILLRLADGHESFLHFFEQSLGFLRKRAELVDF
jgi:hypothetical protein